MRTHPMGSSFYVALATLLWLGGPLGCDGTGPVVPRRDEKILARAREAAPEPADTASGCAKKRVFYRDADGDGFGDRSKPVKACKAPPGFVDNDGDCYDKNRRVHPRQRDYYAVHRGDGSFDYDCDGHETRRFTTRAFCRVSETGCVLASGWGRGKIPACGQPAEFSWKVCREQVIVQPPPGADAGAPATHSAGALVPGAKQKKIYKCGGRRLPWKKRQLCR